MAITEVVRLEIQTQQAKQNMESLSETINEQKLITIELERELQRLEQQLRNTPKTAMAAQRDLNQQINHVKDSISDQRLSLKELQVQQSQTREIDRYTDKQKGLGDSLKITSEETTGLNMVTGGYASQLRRLQLLFGFLQKSAMGFVGSLNAIKIALIATGVGALIVALGAIVAYWDEIKTAVTGVSDEMRQQVKTSRALADARKEELDAINRNDNALKLQGKTEEQILRIKLQRIRAAIEEEKRAISLEELQATAALEQSQRYRQLAESVIIFLSAPLSAVLKGFDLVNKAMGRTSNYLNDYLSMVSGWVFNTDKEQEELDALVAKNSKTLQELENQQAGYQLRLNEMFNQRREKELANEQKLLDELRALRIAELEKQRELQDQVDALANEYFEKFLTDQQREENAVQDKYWNLIEMAQQYGIDTAEIEEARLYELEEIQKRFDAERLEEERRLAQEKLEIERLLQQQKIDLMAQTFGLIAQIIGENSRLGKAAAIAQATMNTWGGVTEVLDTESTLPEPFATISRIANIGTVLATGFNAVRQIAKVKTPGGGGGGASTGGSNPRPPSFNMIGDRGGVSDIQSGIDGQEQPPARAYVVGNDVTTQQEMDRNAVNASGF
jgi:hypothetical protein